ncbi:MAG: hypothetical protein WC627_03775 [Legionella sp.]|jgi:hypothetical protein
MNVVINSDCEAVPKYCRALKSHSSALLNMLVCLGYDPLSLPLADVLKAHYKLQGDWAIVSPIHWEASHNDAMIVALAQDTPDYKCFTVLKNHLAEEGIALIQYSPEIWLMCIDNKPALAAKPVYQLMHHSMMPELAALDKSMYWQKFITEAQMLFASVSISSPINGVWVWGNTPISAKKALKICAEEPFYSLLNDIEVEVSLYHPATAVEDYELLLINDYANLSASQKKQLQKGPVNWYWNNTAYGNLTWLHILWRKLFHAH